MERNINDHHCESIVRQITNERERFVAAWESGAGSRELNEIRENIKELDDLLWETTLPAGNKDHLRSAVSFQRDRGMPPLNRP